MGGKLFPMGMGSRRCFSLSLFSLSLVLVDSAPDPIVHVRNTAEEGRTGGCSDTCAVITYLFKNLKGILDLQCA